MEKNSNPIAETVYYIFFPFLLYRTAQNVTFHNLDVYSQDSVRYSTSNTPYPVCSMTPDVTLWQQLEHYFSLRMRLNISQKEAQIKMAEQISTMKVDVNVIRKPTFSDRSSPWDYLVLSWTEMFYNNSAILGGNVNTVCWQEAAGGPTGSVLDPPLSTWE